MNLALCLAGVHATMSFPRLPPRVMAWVVGIALAGSIASALAAWYQARRNDEASREAFARLCEQVAGQLTARMQLYEYGLRGARGTVLTAGEQGISRELFQRYSRTRDINTEFPGARGFGFVRRVPVSQESAFVQRARQDGMPEFEIHGFGRHGEERFVIQYVEPAQRNQPAIGLDIASEPNRRQAALTALETGKATVTAPVTLVDAVGDTQRAVLLLLPIYRPGQPIATVAERDAAAFGWSYSALSLRDVLADFDFPGGDYQMVLRDITDAKQPGVIFDSARQVASGGDEVFSLTLERSVYGRRWQIELRAMPHFVDRQIQLSPVVVLLAGLATSALMAALVGAVRLSRERERRNSERQAQLATIVENSADAIVGESMNGEVIIWNRAAEMLFGRQRSDAMGQPVAALLLPPERRHEEKDLLDRIARGETLAPFDTTCLRQDGVELDVSMTVGAIRSESGQTIGLAKLIRDIGERKDAERRLREFNLTLERQVAERTADLDTARRDLQTLLDAMPSMIGYWDKSLHNRVANHAYTTWFGVPHGELTGKSMVELLGPEIFARNKPFVDAVLRGEPQRFERAIPRPDGRGMRHSLAHYLPDLRGDEVQGFYVIVHDITEVVESRQALAVERERLANIIKGTSAGTWEWNALTDEVRVNERWAEMLGYTREELGPMDTPALERLAHPDDWAQVDSRLQQHFSGAADDFAVEFRLRHKSGHWVWVQSRGRLSTRTASGAPEWMYGTHQDISATKAAQAEMQRVAKLLASVLGAATELSIIATDPAGLITIFNRGSEQMLGYGADEMVGKSSPAPLHLAEEVEARGLELSAEFGVPVQGFRVFVHKPEIDGAETREWTYVRKDGRRLRVSLIVTAIRGDEGAVVGYLGIAQDIGERLRAEAALRHAKAAAEAANAAKSMFLANMSHEIRTPMNAVIGVAHLLASTPLDGDQRQLLAKLQIAGRSLLGIINDVLDLAKIEAGEMGIERVDFSPVELLYELEQLFMPLADSKGIGLEIHGVASVPARLRGDALRLRQILVNLTSNALKFTSHGRVTVQVAAEGPADREPLWLRWSVRDTGVGISPAALERLFDPFTQADASTTRRFGGTGLGLSIVRRLAHLMDGEVGVESHVGQGSEFWVRLPFGLAGADTADGVAGSGVGLDVVVVDDSDDDRRVLAGLCRALGWRAVELSSGMALQDHFQEALAGNAALPDALLVDWLMPELDGLQALATLAALVAPKRLPATLIISAQERTAIAALDPERLVDHILTKPVGASELFNAVNASVARHTGSTDRVARSTNIEAVDARWLNGLQILLVDDSDINLEVARRLLEREGASVTTSLNGHQALEALRAEPKRFDAVLMDVQMPEMDGYEATRRLRGELGLTELPVLALTAGALGEERRKAEEAGMDDFLTKPLDPANLVRRLRRAVEQASGQPLRLSGSSWQAPLPINWPAIEGVDSRDAAHRLQNDAELFLRMVARLLEEYGRQDFASRAADLSEAALDELTASMHKLRGSSGMLGMSELHRLAGEAEAHLRANAGAAALRARLTAVDQALARLAFAAAPEIAKRAGSSVAPAAVNDAAAPMAPGELDALLTLLRQQDLAAVEQFAKLAPALQAAYGIDRTTPLRRAVDNLDFVTALRLVCELQNAGGG